MPQKRLTVLEIQLPDKIFTRTNGHLPKITDIDEAPVLPVKPAPSNVVQPASVGRSTRATEDKRSVPEHYKGQSKSISLHSGTDDADDTIARSELDLRQVASHVGPDWPVLAMYLGVSEPDMDEISSRYTSDEECAYAMLLHWQEQTSDLQTSGTRLAQALRQLGRDDVLRNCMMNVAPVTSEEERDQALRTLAAAGVSGPYSESSGVGTSLDFSASQATVAPSVEPGPRQSVEMDVIVPVHVTRRAESDQQIVPQQQQQQQSTQPRMDSSERVIVLEGSKQLLQEDEPIRSESPPSNEGVPVEEEVIVPASSQRDAPRSFGSSYQELSLEDALRPQEGGQQGTVHAAAAHEHVYEGPEIEEAPIQATCCPKLGENEATWGRAAMECLTSLESEGALSEPSPDTESAMPEAVVVPAPGWDVSDSDTNLVLFDDIYDQALGELLANRLLNQQPTSLTPIPEVSEYSVLSSSLASAQPASSWDSGDLSPSGSMESRARASRRMLHQLLQQLRQPTDPEFSATEPRVRDLTGNGDPKRRSAEGYPLDPAGQEPAGGSLHTRTSSSRSSLADFIRLETSCEGSRVDLSEEERQLISGQYDASLRDLVAGIQALQRQHLDEAQGAAALASAESSSGSHLAMGSGEAERRVGAGHQEMTHAMEDSPSVSLVASLMAAQMQQLIQSVSASSSSVSSHPRSSASVSSAPSHTTPSDKSSEDRSRDPAPTS
ncbi:unnamed protein product [Echinostoma caproni]|uniref:Death domain-containing protein n=1 Tax=Echinostoma caproni TaxID=27848 RepID=A0A3P8KP02_9TREM|nr:unnamed protein product [Echinostoma caproni]